MRSYRSIMMLAVVAAIAATDANEVQAQQPLPQSIPQRLRISAAFTTPTDEHNLGGGGAMEITYQRAVRPLIMAMTFVEASYIASNRGNLVKAAQRDRLSGGNAAMLAVGGGIQVMGFGSGKPGDRAYPFVSVLGGVEYTCIPDVTYSEGAETSVIWQREESTEPLIGVGVGIAAKPWSTLRFDGEVRYTAAAVKRLHVIVGIGLGL